MPHTSAKLRAKHSSWQSEIDDECIYSGAVTLDPNGVHSAWSRLAQDSWAHEFKSLPALMHIAFIKTLKKSGFLHS